jgi:hypothetical protein
MTRSRSLPLVPLLGGLVTVGAAVAVVVFLVNLLSGSDSGSSSGPGPGPSPTRATEGHSGTPAPADVLSVRGFDDLLAAVKAETGGTSVFDATIYPSYAVLQLPVDRETLRQSAYYWDGRTLKASDSFGRSSDPRIDLTTIDPAAMLRLSHRVRRIVDQPTSWYVVIGAPDDFDKAVVYAYASNKFSEGGYISADAHGKVVRKVTW